MYIPHSVIIGIALLLWWQYCWVPARQQWKHDRARRKQFKYEEKMRKLHGQWPLPEPWGPGWFEYLYRDNPAGLIAREYKRYRRDRHWEERPDAHIEQYYLHRWETQQHGD